MKLFLMESFSNSFTYIGNCSRLPIRSSSIPGVMQCHFGYLVLGDPFQTEILLKPMCVIMEMQSYSHEMHDSLFELLLLPVVTNNIISYS